jgi:L-fucose mutarotase/ribose pyranase (RbsD/FucU family)
MFKSFVNAIVPALLASAITVTAQASNSAGDAEPAKPKEVTNVKDFLANQDALYADIADGHYGSMSEDDMKLINKSRATLKSDLDGVDDIMELPLDKRIEVYNAQEAIKAVVTANVEDRPICKRESTVGTHRPKTVCFTRKERTLMYEKAQEAFSRMPTAPLPSGG